MKKTPGLKRISFLVICSLLMIANAVIAQHSYFQQELSYDIQVHLDDRSHILRGYEKITYINRSPDSLKFIFMHIWPNAYRNDRNEFARQHFEVVEVVFDLLCIRIPYFLIFN